MCGAKFIEEDVRGGHTSHHNPHPLTHVCSGWTLTLLLATSLVSSFVFSRLTTMLGPTMIESTYTGWTRDELLTVSYKFFFIWPTSLPSVAGLRGNCLTGSGCDRVMYRSINFQNTTSLIRKSFNWVKEGLFLKIEVVQQLLWIIKTK